MSAIDLTTKRLKELLENVPHRINEISPEEISYKRAPDKWSKKEIMGHLCDSAINNLDRFIRIQHEPKPFWVKVYDQDNWVKNGNYQQRSIRDVLSFWQSLNRNILHVVSYIPQSSLEYEVYYKGNDLSVYVKPERLKELNFDKKKTFQWLIEDYVAHMEYHLKQVIDI
jgi:hypothetical protein